MIRIAVGLMLVAVAIPMVPPAAADTTCPAGALACVAVSNVGTLTVLGACSLGTTKVAHAHSTPAGGAVSITLSCTGSTSGGTTGVTLTGASCAGTDTCTVVQATALGGDMQCTAAAPEAGYCAIFP